tara:strand:+ start:401 stop:643 length:243 start_codon:yes stop_codon:yes gene_type:complete
MIKFEVGDLVRDKLNMPDVNYGLGVVVDVETREQYVERLEKEGRLHIGDYDTIKGGKKYRVYFTQFERTITFHGDYLERV